jgi:hypothetical protein
MTWKSRVQPIKVGDRVAVSARFLRNTGQHTGDICFCRGKVTELKSFGELILAVIAWESLNGQQPDVPEKMAVSNLSRCTERGIMDND